MGKATLLLLLVLALFAGVEEVVSSAQLHPCIDQCICQRNFASCFQAPALTHRSFPRSDQVYPRVHSLSITPPFCRLINPQTFLRSFPNLSSLAVLRESNGEESKCCPSLPSQIELVGCKLPTTTPKPELIVVTQIEKPKAQTEPLTSILTTTPTPISAPPTNTPPSTRTNTRSISLTSLLPLPTTLPTTHISSKLTPSLLLPSSASNSLAPITPGITDRAGTTPEISRRAETSVDGGGWSGGKDDSQIVRVSSLTTARMTLRRMSEWSPARSSSSAWINPPTSARINPLSSTEITPATAQTSRSSIHPVSTLTSTSKANVTRSIPASSSSPQASQTTKKSSVRPFSSSQQPILQELKREMQALDRGTSIICAYILPSI